MVLPLSRGSLDQVVEHASLGSDISDGARLVHVEMRRTVEDAVTQHAARFRIGLRRRHLKFRAVVFVRNIGGEAMARGQAVRPHQRGGAALKRVATGPTRTRGIFGIHGAGISLSTFFYWSLLDVVILGRYLDGDRRHRLVGRSRQTATLHDETPGVTWRSGQPPERRGSARVLAQCHLETWHSNGAAPAYPIPPSPCITAAPTPRGTLPCAHPAAPPPRCAT